MLDIEPDETHIRTEPAISLVKLNKPATLDRHLTGTPPTSPQHRDPPIDPQGKRRAIASKTPEPAFAGSGSSAP